MTTQTLHTTTTRPPVPFVSPNPAYCFDMPADAHDALIAMLNTRAAERQA